MAEWSYGVNDAATVKLYSRRLMRQAIQRTVAFKLCQVSMKEDGEDNIVQLLTDTQKTEGDTVKYNLLPRLTGPGVIGDNTLAGNEEALATFQDQLLIDQLRHAVLPKGAMSQQRVPFSMRNAARNRLADWWEERLDLFVLNQATGNTFQTDTRFTGLQPCIAPDADHMIFANNRANEGALVPGDKFTIDLIDNYVAIAHSLEVPIRSIKLKGGLEVFGVLFLHPYQVKSLRKNFSQGMWGDIQLAALKGGQITGNPIFSGAIGMYNNVVIHEDNRVPYGDATNNPTGKRFNTLGVLNVARGVFMGAQALAMGFGRAYGKDMKMKWYEELLDGGNQLRVTAAMILGCKKTRFNGADFATVTVSSYETATA